MNIYTYFSISGHLINFMNMFSNFYIYILMQDKESYFPIVFPLMALLSSLLSPVWFEYTFHTVFFNHVIVIDRVILIFIWAIKIVLLLFLMIDYFITYLELLRRLNEIYNYYHKNEIHEKLIHFINTRQSYCGSPYRVYFFLVKVKSN